MSQFIKKGLIFGAILFANSVSPAASILHGHCSVTTTEKGEVKKEEQMILSPVDPWNNFGLALHGTYSQFQVKVNLLVFNYDQIGLASSDSIRMVIEQGSVASHHFLTGQSFVRGESIEGSLQAGDESVRCVVNLN